jgi:hypothetical protein
MSQSDEIQSVLAGLLERQQGMRAVFAVDIAADGTATFSVAPIADLTRNQQDRWTAALRQVADVMREVVHAPWPMTKEQEAAEANLRG